jgi:large conductance mechanosensitive channel
MQGQAHSVPTALFFVVKGINDWKQREAAKSAEPAPPSKQEVLLTEIRNLLKSR